jgi:CheY-like chemotaxis protein
MKKNNRILLIEDDQVDAIVIRRILRGLDAADRLDIVSNGEQALEFLQDPVCCQPSIILLDLNMPRMNGIEFLNIVKKDARLKMIPVIVVTTSESGPDIAESFRLGAAGYMVKPVAYQKLVEIITTIERYWSLSELPPVGSS